MSDEDETFGRAKVPGLVGKMVDKELLERLAQPGVSRKVWMYRRGESRLFDDYSEIPEGEGWVDSPAKVDLPVASSEGAAAVSAPEGDSEDLPQFLAKKPGRKAKATA